MLFALKCQPPPRSLVEVCFKPRLGLPGVKDRDREEVIIQYTLQFCRFLYFVHFYHNGCPFHMCETQQVITRTCTAAVLTSLHPRTAVTINIQESCCSLFLSITIVVTNNLKYDDVLTNVSVDHHCAYKSPYP